MDKTLPHSLQLRLSDEELAALDAYCAAQRRKTGEKVPRTLVIRQAIQFMIEQSAA